MEQGVRGCIEVINYVLNDSRVVPNSPRPKCNYARLGIHVNPYWEHVQNNSSAVGLSVCNAVAVIIVDRYGRVGCRDNEASVVKTIGPTGKHAGTDCFTKIEETAIK